jgi:hypothetical protein
MRPPDEAFAALNRLFFTAESRTEGAEHIASFLLAWANHKEYGGFNLASLARLDALVIKDIQVVTNALFDCGFFRLNDLGFGPKIRNISRVCIKRKYLHNGGSAISAQDQIRGADSKQ